MIVRPMRDDEEQAVADIWHRTGIASYPYLPTWQAFALDHARRVFHDVIRANNAIWVAADASDAPVGFLAISGSYIDRLYIDPPAWRRGWGTRLLEFAKTLSPSGLELATHQENMAARALYEKHGFIAVSFGVSPPPESAPDVQYHWRPGGGRVCS